MNTHDLAEILERLAAVLRREPDQPLGTLLKGLGIVRPGRRGASSPSTVGPATADLSRMSRAEMQAFLKDRANFRTKKDLVAFLRAREVAVTERMRVQDVRDQALRILYDIPKGREELRTYGTTAPEKGDL